MPIHHHEEPRISVQTYGTMTLPLDATAPTANHAIVSAILDAIWSLPAETIDALDLELSQILVAYHSDDQLARRIRCARVGLEGFREYRTERTLTIEQES